MRVALLANDAASYVKPMAEGLHRMLSRLGVESTVFYDGLQRLSALPSGFRDYIVQAGPGPAAIVKCAAKYLLREAPAVGRFMLQLRSYDVIVVVNTIPGAFLKSFFNDVTLRALFPQTPVVLYDVFYLPTRGPWAKWLREGNRDAGIHEGGNWGVSRYDWYLCASVVSETPLPAGRQPYSEIGLDLDDGTLMPGDKSEFIALLDFECPHYMRERAVQIEACEESRTKYLVLNGHYPIHKIRAIYGKASIFFLAMRESFGLPICEAQAAGAYVFTPYGEWCPAHWIKADLSREGPGDLSPNFVVYDNDKSRLVDEIARVKQMYDPNGVVQNFRRYHPQLFSGNERALEQFVQKVHSGEITSLSHQDYRDVDNYVHSRPFEHTALSKPA